MNRGNRHGHVPQVQAAHQEERQPREARFGLGPQSLPLGQGPREEDHHVVPDRSSPAPSFAPVTLLPRCLRHLVLLVVFGAAAGALVAGSAGAAAWKGLAPLAAGPRQETAVVVLGDRIYVLGGFD